MNIKTLLSHLSLWRYVRRTETKCYNKRCPYCSGHLWNIKSLVSHEPGEMTKIIYLFLIINHNITLHFTSADQLKILSWVSHVRWIMPVCLLCNTIVICIFQHHIIYLQLCFFFWEKKKKKLFFLVLETLDPLSLSFFHFWYKISSGSLFSDFTKENTNTSFMIHGNWYIL